MKQTNFISKIILKSAGFLNMFNEVFNEWKPSNIIEKECPDIIFLDINMPGDGWVGIPWRKRKSQSLLQGREIASSLILHARTKKKKEEK